MSFWKKIVSFFKKEEEKKEKVCQDDGVCKHSLHIGINDYPGRANDLNGCVNDANNWCKLLKDQYGFETKVLTNKQATLRNVLREMKKIVKSGADHVVITFSGHGTNIKDVSGDEADRRDEALCLYDKLLVDDVLKKVLDGLSEGSRLTFISDSCHSGTVTRSFLNSLYDEDAPKPRYLPPEDDEEVFMTAPSAVSKKVFSPEDKMGEVLLTGCKATEYSYDAKFSKYEGAMSHFAIEVLKGNPDITYDDFYAKLRKKLPARRYPQTPQLEGSKSNRSKKMFD